MKQWLSLFILTVFAFAGNARAETPQYSKHIQPFLKTYCVECHNSKRAKGRVNLESYDVMMKASRKGVKLITPNEPENSLLLHTLEGKAKQMPPRKYAHQPAAKEVTLVREWIASGAKQDKNATSPAREKTSPQVFQQWIERKFQQLLEIARG